MIHRIHRIGTTALEVSLIDWTLSIAIPHIAEKIHGNALKGSNDSVIPSK